MDKQLTIEIPANADTSPLPNPQLLQYYKNLEQRILWLDTAVDEWWLEYEKLILEWNIEDKEKPIEERIPIKLYFFSYGGSLDINYSFIDIVKASKTPIWAINVGQACSAACFIYVACHKRFAMPNSAFLIHQGGVNGGFSGTYEQVVAAIMEYQKKVDKLGKYLIENTKITQEILDENFETEWYLSASEAVELGVADEIITDIDRII